MEVTGPRSDAEKNADALTLSAEQAVLGAMLIDADIIPAVLSTLRTDDFRLAQNREIFMAFHRLTLAGKTPDPLLVRDRLAKTGTPEYAEISAYLAQLMEITPTSANWGEYAKIIREQQTLRQIRAVAASLSGVYTSIDDCRPLLAQLQTAASGAGRGVESWTTADLINDLLDNFAAETPRDYIRFGLPELDKGTFLERGDVAVIGGYPSDGKTAFAIETACIMGAERKIGFFSLETDRAKLRDRVAAHGLQVSFDRIKTRSCTEADFERIAQNAGTLSRLNVTYVRAAGMTVADIIAVSRAYGFDVIFLDYVQLVRPALSGGKSTRYEQLSGVSIDLHTFAQSTGTTVIELAQLARPERGGWREPDMHDLKETGQFEQDADLILLLFRPGPNSGLNADSTRILKVAKNKEGHIGKWPLHFDGDKQMFSILADDSGRAVARHYAAEGRNARTRNRKQVSLTEIPDNGDMPF